MPVLCLKEWTYRHTFWNSGRASLECLRSQSPLQNSIGNTLSSSSSSSRFVERIMQTPLMRYVTCPSVSRCAANRQHARSIKILSHSYSASSVLVALSVSTAIITVFVKLLEIFSRRIIHPNNFCNVTVRCTAACGSVQPTRLTPAARRASSSRGLMNINKVHECISLVHFQNMPTGA